MSDLCFDFFSIAYFTYNLLEVNKFHYNYATIKCVSSGHDYKQDEYHLLRL